MRQLSIGITRSLTTRVVTIVVLSLFLIPALAALGCVLGLFSGFFTDGQTFVPSVVLAVVLGLAGLVGIGLLLAWMVRLSAWLEPDRLTVRRLRTRTVQLSSATSVALTAKAMNLNKALDKMPLLTVRSPAATVVLPMRSRVGDLLPPDELRALADALVRVRAPGAVEAANWCRAMADDPRRLLL